MMNIELKDLLKAGVHFGHRTSRWSPQMAPYIWGAKNKIHLIDVSKTALLLNRASQFLKEAGREGRQILLIGTKKAAQGIIEKTAKSLEMPYVINRWIGGTLSNNDQVRKAITRLLHLQDALKKSSSYHTKKEMSTLKKEVARLEKNIGGIINFAYPPAALVVVDAKKEHAAVHEALRLNIPVIAMVDTNTDPGNINFVIPANDDSPHSIECIMSYLVAAFQTGRDEAKAHEAQLQAAKEAHAREKAAERVKTHERVQEVVAKEVAPVIAKEVTVAKKEEPVHIPAPKAVIIEKVMAKPTPVVKEKIEEKPVKAVAPQAPKQAPKVETKVVPAAPKKKSTPQEASAKPTSAKKVAPKTAPKKTGSSKK